MQPRTLPELVERLAAHGERPFLSAGAQECSAAATAAAAREWSARLRAAGVQPGERVAIYLEKRVEKATAFLGAGLCGAVSVLVNQRLKDAQVRHVLADCDPSVVITSDAKLAFLSEPRDVLAGRHVRNVDTPAQPARAAETAGPAPAPEDPATILYTSGSTGLPKGIVQSQRSLCDGARIVAGYLALTPRDHLLAVLPLSFDYGLNQLLSAAHAGARVTLLQYLGVADVFTALADGACTGLAGVPTFWVAFCAALRERRVDPARLRALRYVTNSGGRLPIADIRTLRERLPWVEVFSMYGLSEAFRSAFLPPREIDRIPESIGKAIPEVELLVLDESGRRECAVGEAGELVHSGALVADGYWNRPADTARVFRPHPLDPSRGTAVFSGDLVRRDEQGFLFFVGRRDRQLKVMGYRVSPEEIEVELRRVAGVRDACAFGLPDPTLGDRVVAGVTASPDASAGIAERIGQELRSRLPPWLVPAEIHVVEAMPLNQNGKPDARALARLLGYGPGDAAS